MKRKIIRQGASTLTTSLPASWVKEQKIENCDEIEIEQINDKLIISKCKKKETPCIVLGELNKTFIKAAIINLYCKGYDKIRIEFTDPKIENYIRETINNHFIGFEIVMRKEKVCFLENITEPSPDKFEVIFKKILFNLSLLIQRTKKRLKNQKIQTSYSDINRRLQQYENLCKRIIAKRNHLGENTLFFFTALNYLAQAAKEIQLLNRFLDQNKVNTRKIITLFSLLHIYYTLLEKGYLKKDLHAIFALHIYHQKNIQASDFDKLLKLKKKENVLLYHAIVALRNLYLASNSILGMIQK